MNIYFTRENGTKGESIAFHDADGKPYDPILTKQADLEDSDINNIVERFRKTGVLPVLPDKSGNFVDFSSIGTYQDAMIKILEAESLFDALPAKIRAEFGNDPGTFLEFADNPDNHDKMVEMGLLAKPSDLGQATAPVLDAVASPEQ